MKYLKYSLLGLLFIPYITYGCVNDQIATNFNQNGGWDGTYVYYMQTNGKNAYKSDAKSAVICWDGGSNWFISSYNYPNTTCANIGGQSPYFASNGASTPDAVPVGSWVADGIGTDSDAVVTTGTCVEPVALKILGLIKAFWW